MGTGLGGCYPAQGFQRRGSEWTARGGQQDSIDADFLQRLARQQRQTLQYGIVFAVDGQQFCVVLPHLVHEDLTGHDQGFFVGRHQSRRAHDRRHDGIRLRMSGNGLQTFQSGQDLYMTIYLAQVFPQALGGKFIGHHRILRMMHAALFGKALHLGIGGQTNNPIAIRMTLQHVQSTHADGTGSA